MKIIVVAPHPDDETLGCGGTLLKHRDQGNEIYWLIMTSMKEEVGYTKEQIEKRRLEIEKVKKLYGFSKTFKLEIPATQLDQVPMSKLISSIKAIFREVQPETIYLPFMNDNHSDHKKTFEAVYNCSKTFRFPYVRKILMMEVLSETEFAPPQITNTFSPNIFTNIDKYIDQKIRIMETYASELGPSTEPRNRENIIALAKLRGATANCNYAESFMLLKEIS